MFRIDRMESITVGEFKAQFSRILEKVLEGEDVAISYGQRKEKVAVLTPYAKYMKPKKRKLGLLKGKASFKMASDFKMTEDELLQS